MRLSFNIYTFFLTLFILSSVLFSQTEKWSYFNKSNSGLPTDMIRTVVEDKKGVFWIATWDSGLVRFDGKTWENYNTKNSPLPRNSIYCMTFDHQGNLLMGTYGGGVAKFDCKNAWTIYNSKNSGLPNDWIYSIAVDKKSNLWIGTYSEGLAIFNGKKWIVYNKFNSVLPNNKITVLYIDKKDNKIIGTADHIMFIQGNKWKTEKEMGYYNYEDALYWISPYVDNKVLMSYKFGSIVIFDWKTFKVYNNENSNLPFLGFYSVTCDRKKVIWAGSFGNGVVWLNNDKWELFNKTNSGLKDNLVFSVFVDSKNNKWFSTYYGGICLYNEDGVKF